MNDPYEQSIIDDIRRFGWSVACVRAGPSGPGFVYSVGMMETLDHPEIIMFGLEVALMGRLVNDIGADVRTGRRFDEPGLYEGLLKDFACKVLPVAERWHENYMGYAMWHRRRIGAIGTLASVQCLWPDKGGLFPDEPGCHHSVVALQPLLQS
jgi:hypothetical protein